MTSNTRRLRHSSPIVGVAVASIPTCWQRADTPVCTGGLCLFTICKGSIVITVKAKFVSANARMPAEQPRTALSGAGSLVATHGGKLREAITVRSYYNEKGSGMQPVRACVWVHPADGGEWRTGRGSAGGCGYHKESAAIAEAVRNAGIELYGNPYGFRREPVNLKNRFEFGGTGSSAYAEIFSAIARAAGYRGRMIWTSHGL